jgi:pyridoxal phosphate enzyme (YggS family)
VSGPPSVEPAEVADRLAALRELCRREGRGDVTIVAVTKGFGPDAVAAALAAGLADVGESYAPELVAKQDALGPEPGRARWHFVGRLQRNKVRLLAGRVDRWQSVDRPELVAEVARRAPGATVLVQVNLSGEAQKGGCGWDEAPELVALAQDRGLDVQGLMGVAPAGEPALARPGFRRLVALADRLELPERSIGMSADVAVALAEGATTVRVGTGLFGTRPPRR